MTNAVKPPPHEPATHKPAAHKSPPKSAPCQIYLLTPPRIDDIKAFCQSLKTVLATGHIAVLQIRLKDLDDSALIQMAAPIVEICNQANVSVLINDRADIAALVKADGVHIGQSDMDYFSCREQLGGDAIIGVTCHNSKALAFSAAESGADYVAFGAFYDSQTKKPQYRAELEILTWWQEAVEIPCVAIGGLTIGNAKPVIKAGADFIAICSGLWDYPEGPLIAAGHFAKLCQPD